MEELLQNARSANVLSGLFEEDGRNSRRGRKPLSAGDAGIGRPNGGFKGLAFTCCILAVYLSLSKDLLGSAPRMSIARPGQVTRIMTGIMNNLFRLFGIASNGKGAVEARSKCVN